jgi:radical SAM protein with 4Fe4S-binding SPASM domain
MSAEQAVTSKDNSLSRNALRMARVLRKHRREKWAKAAYLLATGLNPTDFTARRELNQMKPRPEGLPDAIRFIGLGTTGLCNASCVHCPTGKASTALSPRNPMPMTLFMSIVDNLFNYGLSVESQVSFGLFGDGLVDPFVVERVKYMRTKLPDVFFSINTNGAAFNAKKHAVLNMDNMVVGLHCESLTPETYDYLMQPLRAERVFPKYEEILETYPGKVHVSVPVSRRNYKELREVRDWFLVRGAAKVQFDPMSSRCAEDRSVFDALSLGPARIACRSDILNDMIIDCDGTLLMCCQDFTRAEPIGNLAKTPFLELFRSARRQQVRELLDNGCHDEFTTCSKCFADLRTENFPFDYEKVIAGVRPLDDADAAAQTQPEPVVS